ncbi:hypothetical protein CBL_00309 [Carabus blaptoides fortunei]
MDERRRDDIASGASYVTTPASTRVRALNRCRRKLDSRAARRKGDIGVRPVKEAVGGNEKDQCLQSARRADGRWERRGSSDQPTRSTARSRLEHIQVVNVTVNPAYSIVAARASTVRMISKLTNNKNSSRVDEQLSSTLLLVVFV